MSKPKQYKTQDFKDAIPGSGGIVSTIAKRVGCDWITARRYIDNSATLTQLYNAERESILDMAEGVLFTNVKAGDSQDAKWVLSRLGKNRGYAERQEITGAEGGPIDVRSLSDEQLQAIIAGKSGG